MRVLLLGFVAVMALVGTAVAEEPVEAPAEEAPEDDLPPHKVGPATVDLGHGVEIELPAGMLLFEAAEVRPMLEKMGEDPEGVLAMIWPAESEIDWSVFVNLVEIGYVSDKDADQLDAAELLEQYKQGTLVQNKKRVAAGQPELFVDSWSLPPSYDHARRVLTWSMNLHDADGTILNDSVGVMGRRGYAQVNLVYSTGDQALARVEAAGAITGVHYQPGHRYEDFDPSVDKDSGIGLREVVVGGGVIAAVKAGKLGLIAKILIALKKFFLVIGLAIAGAFKWIHARVTGRRAAAAAESAEP